MRWTDLARHIAPPPRARSRCAASSDARPTPRAPTAPGRPAPPQIAVDKTFTDKRGERGTLWVGGPLEDPIPGQGEGGDEYVVKVMLMNDLPAASGALIALSDQESVAKAA